MAKKKTNGLKIFVYIFLYAVTIGIVASTFFLHPINRTPLPLLRTVIIIFASVLLTKYLLYMVFSPVYDILKARRELKWKNVIRSYRPKVSVLIPCWNEAVGILETIQSVIQNTYENIE